VVTGERAPFPAPGPADLPEAALFPFLQPKAVFAMAEVLLLGNSRTVVILFRHMNWEQKISWTVPDFGLYPYIPIKM
jgi:hypothetical protein